MQRDTDAGTFAKATERERLLTEEASCDRPRFCRIPGGNEEHVHDRASPESQANGPEHAPHYRRPRKQLSQWCDNEYAIVLTFNQDLTYSDETRITMGRPESTNDDFSVNSAKAYLGDGLE